MTANSQIDFTQAASIGNDLLNRLNVIRESEPIVWNDSVNGWLVNLHEDVLAGFNGRYPLSCVRSEGRSFGSAEQQATMIKRYPLTLSTLPHWVTNVDAPLHTRLRTLMARAFSKKMAEELRPFARATIASVLDSVADRDEIEFVNDVARQITGRVILKKFGLPESHLSRLEKWAYAFNKGLGAIQPSVETLDLVEEILVEMQGVFKTEITRRRAAPTDDFLSQLVMARDGDSQLSEEEMRGICYLTIIAGHDTTLNTMTLGIVALCDNPQARIYLVEHPDGVAASVAELMRFIAMSNAFDRVATSDFEWRGKKIRKGDRVWLMIASANRDPRVYENPDVLDMARANLDRSAVFGPGIHHCVGHLLAKMQLGEFFPAFFRRFPNANVADGVLAFQPAISFRGLDSLRVKLT
jgi:pimeloyl-[acyl-carrier protein] synthase